MAIDLTQPVYAGDYIAVRVTGQTGTLHFGVNGGDIVGKLNAVGLAVNAQTITRGSAWHDVSALSFSDYQDDLVLTPAFDWTQLADVVSQIQQAFYDALGQRPDQVFITNYNDQMEAAPASIDSGSLAGGVSAIGASVSSATSAIGAAASSASSAFTNAAKALTDEVNSLGAGAKSVTQYVIVGAVLLGLGVLFVVGFGPETKNVRIGEL
jgi:hypothetical protein